MNYLILFITILLALSFMFLAGYTVAYKRFSHLLSQHRRTQREQTEPPAPAYEVVSNEPISAQQPTRPAATAARQYRAQVEAAPTPTPTGRKRAQG